ncbi:hypothetical protein DOE59_21245 [Salmonella enterica subsp. diarizonae serovar 48:i:z]|uniref:Uncharacterized protein n=1 Tax=Salmonella enterica subsp. diarizonae serovar 48:i:z TaxID=1192842 RepID=A0A7U6BH13_SALDZ|nr:hypothetical protein DOE59_21245 [Salmonella enterica subsp. diarizonae serovar 48:i:z]EAA4453297.1 hypothetical protein [Salmonella enterica subsp. diarizonae]EAM6404586.1 hypothetical protein [Salmonella enterica]EAN2411034.1 hypothetical protein [Salmonella enterica]EAP0948798.1 hypothetical protein [Salmonella enterica]
MKRKNRFFASCFIFTAASFLFFIFCFVNYQSYESIIIIVFYVGLVFIPVSLILQAFITDCK